MTDKPRCTAKTKAGKPCKAAPLHGTDKCMAHSDAETRESAGFIAANGKGGRPPTPRVIDILRERIEAQIDEVVAPLFDALGADRGLVVGNGPTAEVEMVVDHPTRIAAVRELLDRVYGRPRQTTEVTGAGGQPLIAPALPTTDDWRADVARALADLGSPVPALNGSSNGSRNGHG